MRLRALGAVAAVLLAAGCGPTGPNAQPSTPGVPAVPIPNPSIDAQPPMPPNPVVRGYVVVRVTDEVDNPQGWDVLERVKFTGTGGAIFYEQGGQMGTGEKWSPRVTPYRLPVAWEPPITFAEVTITANLVPSGWTLECQPQNASGAPLDIVWLTAPLDPPGVYTLSVTCPVMG